MEENERKKLEYPPCRVPYMRAFTDQLQLTFLEGALWQKRMQI